MPAERVHLKYCQECGTVQVLPKGAAVIHCPVCKEPQVFTEVKVRPDGTFAVEGK